MASRQGAFNSATLPLTLEIENINHSQIRIRAIEVRRSYIVLLGKLDKCRSILRIFDRQWRSFDGMPEKCIEYGPQSLGKVPDIVVKVSVKFSNDGYLRVVVKKNNTSEMNGLKLSEGVVDLSL